MDKRAIHRFKKKAVMRERYSQQALDVSNETLIRNLMGYENDYRTRSAMMCFYENPEKFYLGAYIKIAYFRTDADIVFQDEIHGALINQVDDTLELIYTKYMKALIDYDGIYRRETYFFPIDAFRELLLNAVIHKDYMQPFPIQIKVYPEKIRIWNIGKMPSQIQIDKLYEPHFSVPRNPNIASIFFKCGSIESWGRGYFNIAKYCKEQSALLPTPEENTGGVMVECRASEKYHQLAKSSLESSLETTAEKILSLMKNKPDITTQEIADRIGISRRAVTKQIATEGYTANLIEVFQHIFVQTVITVITETYPDEEKLYAESQIFWHAKGIGEENPLYFEHFGITTVEAMSAGCVPIVINKGGQKEIVDDLCGFRWNTLDELVALTENLVLQSEKIPTFRENAIQRSKLYEKQAFEMSLRNVFSEKLQ